MPECHKKSLDIEHFIAIHDLYLVELRETWLHDCVLDNKFAPPAYCAYRRDRDSRSGGVAPLFKRHLKVMEMLDAAGVEALFCKLF